MDKYYSPKLWELVESGKISEKSALYNWLNADAGQIIVDGNKYWIEVWTEYPNKTAFKQLDDIMEKVFHKEYYMKWQNQLVRAEK